MMLIKPLQVGGIIGGVGLVLNILIPQVPVWVWVCLAAPTVSLMIFRGKYQFIEILSLVMIGCFALFTLACLIGVQFTEFEMSRAQIFEGLSFWNGIPPAAIGVAIAAFGITGVGGRGHGLQLLAAGEGYAARTGPREDTPEWTGPGERLDPHHYWYALLSMLVYTFMTVAFYLGPPFFMRKG